MTIREEIMASIQTQTLNALMPNTEYVTQGDISNEADLATVIEFVTGEEADGTAITQAWTTDNPTYSPFTYAQYTAKYTELENARPLEKLRKERNRLLAETDWWVLPDRTATQVQTDYRQALRDITTQTPTLDSNGELQGITWPTKP